MGQASRGGVAPAPNRRPTYPSSDPIAPRAHAAPSRTKRLSPDRAPRSSVKIRASAVAKGTLSARRALCRGPHTLHGTVVRLTVFIADAV
jgi:hypothetical protein